MKNKIAIVGLGYVGLPLYLSFSKKFKVVGYDKKVIELKNLKSILIAIMNLQRKN